MRKFPFNNYLKEIVEKSNSDNEIIRKLNDLLRTTFESWKVTLTIWVCKLTLNDQKRVMTKVRTFKNFSENNDPYQEHDFWSIEIDGEKYFWKIDYYSKKNEWWGSPNPADPNLTERVLTIMRADEY